MQDLLDQLPPELHQAAQDLEPRRLRKALDLLDQRIGDVAVVMEAVRRRHNSSAILRSTEAFGFHQAHVVSNSFRPAPGASRGAERWLDLSMHATTEDCLDVLEGQGYETWVADFNEGAVPPWEVPTDRKISLVFGSEVVGVSAEARGRASGTVFIPTVGVTQSLNVSAAASIILAQVSQSRRAAGISHLTQEQRIRFLTRFVNREHGRVKSGYRLYELPSGEVPLE